MKLVSGLIFCQNLSMLEFLEHLYQKILFFRVLINQFLPPTFFRGMLCHICDVPVTKTSMDQSELVNVGAQIVREKKKKKILSFRRQVSAGDNGGTAGTGRAQDGFNTSTRECCYSNTFRSMFTYRPGERGGE